MKKTLVSLLFAFTTALSLAAVDINKATLADLDSIKGIGPATSTRMVDERKAAPFKDWADLIQRVPGIGDKRAAKLSTEGLTVNGASFKPHDTKPAEGKVTGKKPVQAQ